MPEQVVITKELIETNPCKNSGIFDFMAPKRIRCGLCMPPAKGKYHYRRFHILREGSLAIKVVFRNKQVAYYGLQCWQDPKNADRVARILKQEYKPKIQQAQTVS